MYPISKDPRLCGLFQYTKDGCDWVWSLDTVCTCSLHQCYCFVLYQWFIWCRPIFDVPCFYCCTNDLSGIISSLCNAPISKDPSVHIVVQYTREAEIESAYQRWYVLYTHIVVCGFIWYHPLYSMLKFLRTQAYTVSLNTPEKLRLSLLSRDGMFFIPV